MADQKDSIKDILAKGGCYLGNIAEMFDETADVMVENEEGKVVLDFNGARDVVQVIWDKFKETMAECAGKEVEVRLPEGVIGGLVAAALGALGFRL